MAVKDMQNWWDQLQAEADRQSDQTDINGQRLMSIATTAALDRVARTGLGAMVCSALAPMLLGRGKLEREAEKLRFYARFADNANLDETFRHAKIERRPLVGVESMRHAARAGALLFCRLTPISVGGVGERVSEWVSGWVGGSFGRHRTRCGS